MHSRGATYLSFFYEKKAWKFWETVTMGPFFSIQRDILPRLVTNLKEKGKVCYLFFTVDTLPEAMCDSAVEVDCVREALSLASYNLTLYQRDPKEFPGGCDDGIGAHLLILKEDTIANIARIVSLVSCRDFECFLIFDSEANKDKLFTEIKSSCENRYLKKNIVSLSSEVIDIH